MQTFLIAVAGAMVGLVLVVWLGWLWLKRKFRGLGDALKAMCAAGGIAPLRISLRTPEEPPWREASSVDAATRSFEAAGYQPVGDYAIPEMGEVAIRAFWHPECASYGVVYDHEQAGLFADLVRLFRDRSWLTVTTAPDTGMDRPDHARLERMELDVTQLDTVGRMHEVLEDGSRGKEPVRKLAESFPTVFVGAYALEMDWRIARGGVTAEEVRRAAAAGGMEPPDEQAVEIVQAAWRSNIESFVSDEILKAFPSRSGMSAAEWEEKRERIFVVHEHMARDELIDGLGWRMIAGSYPEDDDEAEERAHAEAKQRLEAAFAVDSLRKGYAAAQQLLPEKRRSELVGRVAQPWPADVYLEPETPEEL